MKKIFLLIALTSFLNSKAQDVSVINTQDVFSVTMGFYNLDPMADASNYLFGAIAQNLSPATALGRRLIKFPFNVTCIGASITGIAGGTLGTAETATVYVRVNGVDNIVNSAVTFDAINTTFAGTGLTISIPSNTTFEGKITTPTFATNPTQVSLSVTYFFRRD